MRLYRLETNDGVSYRYLVRPLKAFEREAKKWVKSGKPLKDFRFNYTLVRRSRPLD